MSGLLRRRFMMLCAIGGLMSAHASDAVCAARRSQPQVEETEIVEGPELPIDEAVPPGTAKPTPPRRRNVPAMPPKHSQRRFADEYLYDHMHPRNFSAVPVPPYDPYYAYPHMREGVYAYPYGWFGVKSRSRYVFPHGYHRQPLPRLHRDKPPQQFYQPVGPVH